jgi:hypothetical protein
MKRHTHRMPPPSRAHASRRPPRFAPRKALAPLALATVGMLSATAAEAGGDLQLSSDTMFGGFSRPGLQDSSDHYAFYEFVRLRTRDTGIAGLSLQASVWGRIEAGDIYTDEARATGDVNVLLARYHAPENSRFEGLELLVGRQFVPVGPSMLEQLDGATVRYRLPFGISATAFGGAVSGIRFVRQPWPVNQDDLEYGGNWTAGGRLGYSLGEHLTVGAGYRIKQYDGHTAFNELNWDFLAAPFSWLELFGDGVVELTVERLKQARVASRLQLTRALAATLGYRYSSPDLFIPRTSIFSVFSDELLQEAFVEGDWRASRALSMRGELAGVLYGETCSTGVLADETCDDAELQLRALGRADLRFGFAGRHRLTAEIERRGAPDGGYWRWRVANSLRATERLSLIVDLDWVYFDEPNEDFFARADDPHRWGLAGSGYLGWQMNEQLSLLAGGRVWTSQLFDSAGSVMVRLSWTLDRMPDGTTGPDVATGPVQVERSPQATSLMGGLL